MTIAITNMPDYNGFVELVEVMGNDQEIIDSVLGFWEPQQITREQDLIDYMYRIKHTSPFEMCEVKFHLKFNGELIKKIFRHRTASINVSSLRYEYLTDSFFDDGSFINAGDDITRTTNELYIKMNLNNFFKFMVLRLDPTINDPLLESTVPQEDVHAYSMAMYNLVKPLFPKACQAFEKYELNSVHFSSLEKQVLSQLLTWDESMHSKATALGFNGKELAEFQAKIQNIGNNIV